MATRTKARSPPARGRAGQRGASPRLAKLTRPQISKAVPRARLFALLDAAEEQPLVWITGPPGAGKTTLVASYVSAKKRPDLWYQIDHGDGDIATFFYYLGLAVAHTDPRKRIGLPLLTPEYLPDIEGFTRRFFRKAYASLPSGSVIVFDNYQEVEVESPFHAVLAWASSEIPEGVRVMVISRSEPPAHYSRHRANSLIAPIDWRDLRLTLDETTLIAKARHPVEDELLQVLHDQSEGWAAGVVLMLERLKQTGTVSDFTRTGSTGTLFDYFVAQIFEQLGVATRETLLRTSVLPRVTIELAQDLSGRPDAARLLDELYHEQFLVDRRVGDTVTYQYHALFRAFLQAEARHEYTEAEWKALLVASADALTRYGQPEEAVPLFIAAGAYDRAIRLILTQAQGLLILGRWGTLQHWIESLPDPARALSPWLGFWLGMCRLRVNPPESRSLLEPAFHAFQKNDDTRGQIFAAVAIIESHMAEWVDYRRLDPWIALLEALLNRGDLVVPTPDTDLAIRAGLFTAIVYRQTSRDDIPVLARQLADLLRQEDLDPNYKLLAARGLFMYGAYSGDFVLTDEVASFTKAAYAAPGASALNRAWYAARLGFAMRYMPMKSPEEARSWFQEARHIVREHGLRFLEAPIAIYWAWSEEVFGEVADLERELGIAKVHLNPSSHFEAAFYQTGLAFLCVRHGDHSAAVSHLREALAFFRQSGSTLGQAASQTGLAGTLLDSNDVVGARDALDGALSVLIQGPLRLYIEAMSEATIALRLSDEEGARTNLRFALSLGTTHGLENTLSEHLFHRTTAALCAYALKHGIEPDYVKRIIRAQRLAAPTPDLEDWAWPARIRALGAFSLEIDGQPVSFSGKAPKKPLELLKALVAMGGTHVDIGWLCDQLWPEAEGDAARDAFHVTHSRLRKLFPMDDLLMLSEGKLSLDPEQVWTDVRAFERVAEECLEKLRRPVERSGIESAGERLLSLYPGDLLKGEPDAPWLVAARDRLRSKLLRALRALGGYWEAREAWEQAQSLYERLLEVDNVAEEVYRRLMSCYARSGQLAEALRVYRRCRQMLSLVLGIAPAAETESLYRSIAQTQ